MLIVISDTTAKEYWHLKKGCDFSNRKKIMEYKKISHKRIISGTIHHRYHIWTCLSENEHLAIPNDGMQPNKLFTKKCLVQYHLQIKYRVITFLSIKVIFKFKWLGKKPNKVDCTAMLNTPSFFGSLQFSLVYTGPMSNSLFIHPRSQGEYSCRFRTMAWCKQLADISHPHRSPIVATSN